MHEPKLAVVVNWREPPNASKPLPRLRYPDAVNLIFRTILRMIRSRYSSKLHMTDVGRMDFRVVPTDIDVLGHMNNGVYFSIMDLGRIDLMIRAGAWKALRAKGWYPVMANETMSFRKSLDLWKKYTLETRLVGYDGKAVYVEQRFVVDGEIYASAMTRARFLKSTGGTVPVAELAQLLGADAATHEPPAWVSAWAAQVALPTTREPAPSTWD